MPKPDGLPYPNAAMEYGRFSQHHLKKIDEHNLAASAIRVFMYFLLNMDKSTGVLHHITYAEIAQAKNMPLSTVYWAVGKLREAELYEPGRKSAVIDGKILGVAELDHRISEISKEAAQKKKHNRSDNSKQNNPEPSPEDANEKAKIEASRKPSEAEKAKIRASQKRNIEKSQKQIEEEQKVDGYRPTQEQLKKMFADADAEAHAATSSTASTQHISDTLSDSTLEKEN